jgi:hypothetical protein
MGREWKGSVVEVLGVAGLGHMVEAAAVMVLGIGLWRWLVRRGR